MTVTAAWRLRLPQEVVFGRGARHQLPDLLPAGARVLAVVSASTAGMVDELLPDADSEVARVMVSGEPVLDAVSAEVERVRPAAPDLVLAAGGGSVLDTAKALAAFLTNQEHAPRDYLEVVGAGYPLTTDPLPVVAVPTTAGTGAEATHNAVLGVPDAARKVSLRDPRLTPRIALVDPECSEQVPHAVAVAAGLDAAVQLVEAAATPLASPPTTTAALTGAEAALPALERLVEGSASQADRDALAYGALLSGIALANSKLGTVHGFAAVLGGHRDLAHGALCGWFAAPVLSATMEQLRAEQPSSALERYAQLATLATGEPAEPEALADWFAEVVAAAALPTLDLDDLPTEEVVTAVQQASSTRGNPVALSTDRLRRLLAEVAATHNG